jgi:hypothetical protein
MAKHKTARSFHKRALSGLQDAGYVPAHKLEDHRDRDCQHGDALRIDPTYHLLARPLQKAQPR